MGLSNTKEFWVVGIIVGAILVIGIIYFYKLLSGRDWYTQTRVTALPNGGRRKRLRLRQIRKKRR